MRSVLEQLAPTVHTIAGIVGFECKIGGGRLFHSGIREICFSKMEIDLVGTLDW
jgi:hypothetical protein